MTIMMMAVANMTIWSIMMNDNFYLTLIQQAYTGNREEMMQSTHNAIKSVAKHTDVILLQELHTTEYFCQTQAEHIFDYGLYFDENVAYFSRIAKENSVVLIGSFFERRAAGLYHNTAVVFEKDGSIAGKYRKMHIPDDPLFYEKYYFTPGDLGFEPINTSVGRLGVLVCWDQWFPEAARIMALKGADILLYPTAIGWFLEDDYDEQSRQLQSWIAIQRSHAIANGIPVAACNRVGFEAHPHNQNKGICFWGNSFVFGAQGEKLGQLGEQGGILHVCIDKNRSESVRRTWPFLRDRRIDAYNGLLSRFL